MGKGICYLIVAALLAVTPDMLLAQESNYHSALSDRFIVSVGAFRSSNSFKIEADTLSDLGDEIDFGDKLGVSNHSTLVNAQLRWKLGSTKKWSLWGQYFSNSAKGTASLDQDYDWDGILFPEGSFVEAGVKLKIARVFAGRSLFLNDQHDFGVGIGIHHLDLDAYIKGEILINGGTTGEREGDVGGSQILPNVGSWYNFSPASRWLLHARVDWISANLGDYDGTLWNSSAGINFQAWRHIGFDLSWQYFNLDINVEKSDWRGGAKLRYSGPVLGMTASW